MQTNTALVFSSPKISESELPSALDAMVRDGLRPILVGLSVLFAVGHAPLLPKAAAIPMTIVAALYRAKAQGRDRVVVLAALMSVKISQSPDLQSA